MGVIYSVGVVSYGAIGTVYDCLYDSHRLLFRGMEVQLHALVSYAFLWLPLLSNPPEVGMGGQCSWQRDKKCASLIVHSPIPMLREVESTLTPTLIPTT